MQPGIEVIDVEEFHEHLQRKHLDDLRRKYKKLKEENRSNHLNRANDDLSRTLFEQDQCRNGLARRLGFDSVESAEASITSEDPWVSGGKVALSEAHARLLLLEDELAKHITAGEEAQSVLTETKEQLEETHQCLNEALEDTARLREERDLARLEADRQAIEANKWRNEVQTALPEMQNLLREQQQRNQALLASRPTASPDKGENPYEFGSAIPLSQQSLTQSSSMASPSPLRAPKDMPHAVTKEGAQPKVFAIDSPPRKLVAVKQEGLIIKNEEASQTNAALRRSASLAFAPDTPVRTRTPQTTPTRLLQRQKLKNAKPISEPPPANRLSHPSPANGHDIRRTNTILVMDTPRRTNADALTRHHSSPPDSPHLCRGEKRKRTTEETDDDGDSDPFRAGSSRVPATVFQTRDEKLARLKVLHKEPKKGYMAEYTQFKGRGRYSNANAAPSKSLNGKFEIDPDKNDGLDFQYDGVVRDRDKRRRLEAGDCECCRGYYEAVGPLPPRLQAPLWKSPSSNKNQHATRPCRYENKMSMSSPSARVHTKAVGDHKQSISRHRHNWAPPNTPPDFWKIEFPDTPTVKDINRRADEMHAHKFERVEAEANSSNGRYRRRT
ncbi:DNA repair protein endonuclease SAE2/CtIP C-terminus-domain-containing protein [Gautieria morchelliformis]|nr:DNA repair protein endonuclease SAE2/CtIP C-terminus-domain-containing protein [Gautieria morchelliformis]